MGASLLGLPPLPLWEVMLVCAIIMIICLATGALMVKNGLAGGSIPPLLLCFVGGLLMGISVLVVLPETIESMPTWPVERVLLIFLSAVMFMFFLDHCVLEHDHSHGAGGPSSGCTDDSCTGCEDPKVAVGSDSATLDATKAPPVSAMPVVIEGERSEYAIAIPCEEPGETEPRPQPQPQSQKEQEQLQGTLQTPPQHHTSNPGGSPPGAPPPDPCDCKTCDPFAFGIPKRGGGGRGFGTFVGGLKLGVGLKSGVKLSEQTGLLTGSHQVLEPSSDRILGGVPSMEARESKSQTCISALSTMLRLCAWLLHAMLDGMVLSSATTTPSLIAIAIPVSICSIQDVAAFTVSMGAHGLSDRDMMLCVFAFSLAFPAGAGLALHAYAIPANRAALGVMRAFVAGVFVYMALFEMSPPHAHGRWVNLKYLACFILGVACAYSAELVEDITEQLGGGQSAHMSQLLDRRLW